MVGMWRLTRDRDSLYFPGSGSCLIITVPGVCPVSSSPSHSRARRCPRACAALAMSSLLSGFTPSPAGSPVSSEAAFSIPSRAFSISPGVGPSPPLVLESSPELTGLPLVSWPSPPGEPVSRSSSSGVSLPLSGLPLSSLPCPPDRFPPDCLSSPGCRCPSLSTWPCLSLLSAMNRLIISSISLAFSIVSEVRSGYGVRISRISRSSAPNSSLISSVKAAGYRTIARMALKSLATGSEGTLSSSFLRSYLPK